MAEQVNEREVLKQGIKDGRAMLDTIEQLMDMMPSFETQANIKKARQMIDAVESSAEPEPPVREWCCVTPVTGPHRSGCEVSPEAQEIKRLTALEATFRLKDASLSNRIIRQESTINTLQGRVGKLTEDNEKLSEETMVARREAREAREKLSEYSTAHRREMQYVRGLLEGVVSFPWQANINECGPPIHAGG